MGYQKYRVFNGKVEICLTIEEHARLIDVPHDCEKVISRALTRTLNKGYWEP